MQYAAETLRAAPPALEKAGVVIGIEPLSPDVTNFVNTAADGEELIELVGSPHVRLHLDCLAMSHEPTPIPDLIRKHPRGWCISTPTIPTAWGPASARWISGRFSRPCVAPLEVYGACWLWCCC